MGRFKAATHKTDTLYIKSSLMFSIVDWYTKLWLVPASGNLLAHNDVTSGSSHLDTSQATAPPPDVTRDVIAQNETEAELVTSQNSTHDDSEEMTQMTQSHTGEAGMAE